MKKLSVFEITVIAALVALTIVVKMMFAPIPGIEFTTPIFVVLAILLKRNISLFYVVVFLIADSLLIMKGNVPFSIINALMWLSIYGLCLGVKMIKWQRPVFVFCTGLVAVLLQTVAWILLMPIFVPSMAMPITTTLILTSWGADFVTGHPIIAGGVSVLLYFALLGMSKTYRLNSIFDK